MSSNTQLASGELSGENVWGIFWERGINLSWGEMSWKFPGGVSGEGNFSGRGIIFHGGM